MAATIMCDVCGQEPAAVMQSSLGDGETIAIGQGCLMPYYLTAVIGMLDAMDPADATAYRDAFAPLITQVAGPDGIPPAVTAPRDAGDPLHQAAATGAGLPVARDRPRRKPAPPPAATTTESEASDA